MLELSGWPQCCSHLPTSIEHEVELFTMYCEVLHETQKCMWEVECMRMAWQASAWQAVECQMEPCLSPQYHTSSRGCWTCRQNISQTEPACSAPSLSVGSETVVMLGWTCCMAQSSNHRAVPMVYCAMPHLLHHSTATAPAAPAHTITCFIFLPIP